MFTPTGQPDKKTVTISHEGDIIDYNKKVILKKPTPTQEKFRGMEGTATVTSKPTEEIGAAYFLPVFFERCCAS